jgi:hypothetical protein
MRANKTINPALTSLRLVRAAYGQRQATEMDGLKQIIEFINSDMT